jgi:hypothetical protein
MSSYNTHDCHTMLSLFLAIAIRVANHLYLKMVITHMCHFFNAIVDDQIWQVWKNRIIWFAISEHPVLAVSEQSQGRS